MSAALPDPRLNAYRDDLADRCLEGLVRAARYTDGEPRRVVAAAAPLRRAPHDGAGLDTEALHGEHVRVFEEAAGWAWGQLEGDGYVGYLPASALGPRGDEATHRVAALRTFVFPEPSIKAPPRMCLSLGARVRVVGAEGRLAKLAGGGFVAATHLAPLSVLESDPVGVAARFLGTPYLWGGRTSLGLDCSGLVQIAFQAAGRPAPRDSDMQLRAFGEPVPGGFEVARLVRGDLLFWKGHVGIVAGPGRLLHANAFHMEVVDEPLAAAIERIAASGSPLAAIGRTRLA